MAVSAIDPQALPDRVRAVHERVADLICDALEALTNLNDGDEKRAVLELAMTIKQLALMIVDRDRGERYG